ncbi:MAG TPA: hypothetical protein VH141_20020 [Pseudonocardia sp.]|nr:hypothetical protein [Pseudonocardia sp.]
MSGVDWLGGDLLIGRFKPREIRLWSLGYLRLWTVLVGGCRG